MVCFLTTLHENSLDNERISTAKVEGFLLSVKFDNIFPYDEGWEQL